MDKDFKNPFHITLTQTEAVKAGDPLEGHDFILISKNHHICSSYIKTMVRNVPRFADGLSVVYAYLQEVEGVCQ